MLLWRELNSTTLDLIKRFILLHWCLHTLKNPHICPVAVLMSVFAFSPFVPSNVGDEEFSTKDSGSEAGKVVPRCRRLQNMKYIFVFPMYS